MNEFPPKQTQWPWLPTGMVCVGAALMGAPLLARQLFMGYEMLVVVAGSMLFMIGLKVTIMELPEIHVPTWLGLTIVVVLGLSLPAFVLVAWIAQKFI